MPKEMLPAAQRESRKKSHQPSELGRGGDPREAGAPQQARISPARSAGRCTPIAPCGERRTRYTTCDSDALRHTEKGSTGVVGGVEGLAPLTPCRQPRRLPHPDAGLKPPASGKKNRLYAETEEMTFRRSEGNLHAEGDAPRRATRKPEKNTSPASWGAEAIPAKREDARRLPPAASGGQGIRHATVTPAATRTRGEYGGRRGCRGARPSHPLPPAAQATPP